MYETGASGLEDAAEAEEMAATCKVVGVVPPKSGESLPVYKFAEPIGYSLSKISSELEHRNTTHEQSLLIWSR